MSMPSAHSAEQFADARDYWWNESYLDLLSYEWQKLIQPKSGADLGCGIGHWTKIFARIFPSLEKIYAVDFEIDWIKKIKEIDLTNLEAIHANIEYLPFGDNSLDVITCQTVLMHVPKIEKVLAEINRVLKPGGFFFAIEPNNLANYYAPDSANAKLTIEQYTEWVAFCKYCSLGRKRLGHGDDAIGEILPQYLMNLGFQNINVRLNNKVNLILPPYQTEEEKAFIRQFEDWERDGTGLFNPTELKRMAQAGGLTDIGINHGLAILDSYTKEYFRQIQNGEYYALGGHLLYIITAQKT